MNFSVIITLMKIPGHKVYYEQATRNILARLKEMNLSPEKYKRATDLVVKFRKAFTSDDVKKATFITPDNDVWNLGYDSIGFCRVASISFAIAMDFHDWQLMSIDEKLWSKNMGHHWLKHLPTGKIFDITYDQFTVDGIEFPYHLGHEARFYLSSEDETHKFVECLGMTIKELLMEDKSK